MKAKLQKKFIAIVMISLVIIMTLFVITINGINMLQMEKRMSSTIGLLTENRGKFPKPDMKPGNDFFIGKDFPLGFQINEETQFITRYFLVEYNKDYDIRKIDTSHISAVSSEDALEYANKIINSGQRRGYEGIYRYELIERMDSNVIVFLDSRQQIQTTIIFLVISVAVAIIILLLLFIPVTLFSKRAVAPIIDSMEKQKAFIADASHEIKTPLAIISANADVLELTSGKNEWISSIRNQTNRLDKLVKNLLTLTKMDQGIVSSNMEEFDLSCVLLETAESFIPIAEANKKKYSMDIQANIRFMGVEEGLIQLLSTLLENAFKYSNEKGQVHVKLSRDKKEIKLDVSNTTDEIEDYSKEHLNKLFDRFYRIDSSRTRSLGGYGIGLSIAKSIVEAHHGTIFPYSEDGKSIIFKVRFKVAFKSREYT